MDRGAWRAPVHRIPKNWTQLSFWTCTYNKAGPSEKHWPIFRWWSLLCGKSCILVLEKSILMQLNLSHTIIHSKNWNAKKYMVVLTPRVSIHLWKLSSLKVTSFLITDTFLNFIFKLFFFTSQEWYILTRTLICKFKIYFSKT